MSVNKYVNGKLLQVSGNADTRLTFDDIISILGYTPVNPNIIGTELATLNSSGKLEDSQKPSYSWSEITGKPSSFTPSSHTHSYAGSSSAGGAATSALTLTTARTLTIGNSGKTFDGSTDVSWSLSEIGAASQSDLDILNSNISRYGSEEAFVSFTYFGDYWWCSSPIPLMNASDLTIIISDDLKNVTGNGTTSIPSTYFEIRKNKDFFYILTNDQSTAGYTFNTLLPNRMWIIKYEILKLSA